MAKRQGAGAASGNVRFKALRHARGWVSQQQLADAFEEKARECGLRLAVSVRQVRRWESTEPPWPTPDYQKVLQELFGMPLTDLGFTPPWHPGGDAAHVNSRTPQGPPNGGFAPVRADDRTGAPAGDLLAYESPYGEPLFASDDPYDPYDLNGHGGWPGRHSGGPADPDDDLLAARPPGADGPGAAGVFTPYESPYRPVLDPEHGDGLGPAPSAGDPAGHGGRAPLPMPRSIAHIFDGDAAGRDESSPPAEEFHGGPLNGAAAAARPTTRAVLAAGRRRATSRRKRIRSVIPVRTLPGRLITGPAPKTQGARVP